MEIEVIHLVASFGFAIGLIFGGVSNKTNFCTMGAISDWVNMGLKGRLGSWVMAMGIAIAGAQILEMLQLIDLPSSIYRSTTFGWGGYVIGGLMFGVGMTMAGGCGQRTLVRVGGGNLKSFVAFLMLALTAYMTMRGILAIPRVELFEPLSVDLSLKGIEDQGLFTLIGHGFGIEIPSFVRWIGTAVIAGILIVWAFSLNEVRNDKNNLVSGVVVGLLAVAAWAVTGILGNDDFDPVPIEGLSFIAPSANSLSYLMTFTGSTIGFGIAVVFGIITGSFLYAVASRTFRIETFTHQQDMVNHLLGGTLMGIGGVLSLGCTVGQGISGISTLAVGSIIAIISIIIGSAITMRVQYYRMDELGMLSAWSAGIADILIPWRKFD